ncbi:hypothetical protein Q9L58_010656, partial [Maublancomyces gigas]
MPLKGKEIQVRATPKAPKQIQPNPPSTTNPDGSHMTIPWQAGSVHTPNETAIKNYNGTYSQGSHFHYRNDPAKWTAPTRHIQTSAALAHLDIILNSDGTPCSLTHMTQTRRKLHSHQSSGSETQT